RADSEVTSTGMLPLITKRRDEQEHDTKPRSRREARAHARRAAEPQEDNFETAKAPEEEQTQPVPAKPVRRATSPQAPPPPVPAIGQKSEVVQDDEAAAESAEDTVVLSTWERYGESAVEITDMSGLDTLEIRRAELRDE